MYVYIYIYIYIYVLHSTAALKPSDRQKLAATLCTALRRGRGSDSSEADEAGMAWARVYQELEFVTDKIEDAAGAQFA